ncbi:MAG: PEP-CTERM sorting domain-containing protein [Verrucomicrobiota bacterium]
MKRLAILIALALVAGTASANIILTDAEWATAWESPDGTGSALTLPGVDIAGDPGYEFTVLANPIHDWGWGTPIGYSQAVVSMNGAALDVWDVEVKNTHATSATAVQLVGWFDDGAGNQWNYVQSVVWSPAPLLPGQSASLSWDTTTTGYSSITALGVMIVGTEAYGPEVTVAMIPEPATFGLVGLLGGGLLFVRKRFMI